MKTPMKSIRAKCLDCCCGSAQEVRLCPAADCPLYSYRLGHRPKGADSDGICEETGAGVKDTAADATGEKSEATTAENGAESGG